MLFSKKNLVDFSKFVLLSVGMSSALILTGCSDSSNSTPETTASESVSQPAQTNAMDVKQPELESVAKQPLVSLPEKVSVNSSEEKPTLPEIRPKEAVDSSANADVIESHVEKRLEVIEKEAAPVAVVAEVDGASVYATCASCHGMQGEGAIGPKLAGQSFEDMVDKLHRYKAGEQIGPLTGMMAPMAAPLTDAQITAVAKYASGL